jgi:TetR/AcrR family transcriptional regulator, transcriptional repressor for nem operon
MRRSREDAAETRRLIVETASRLFRLRGITAVSVADIMGALGLTVGGFYRHFESKEALVIEAIAAASTEMELRYAQPATGTASVSPGAALDSYLSRAHRDHPERGCPVSALCSEVAHESLPTRQAFTTSVQRLLAIVASLAPGDTKDARDRRLHAVASMVGAVVLARATSDEALADDLLRVVRTGVHRDTLRAAAKPPKLRRSVHRGRSSRTSPRRAPRTRS